MYDQICKWAADTRASSSVLNTGKNVSDCCGCSQIKYCFYEKLCEIVKMRHKWEANEFASLFMKESRNDVMCQVSEKSLPNYLDLTNIGIKKYRNY